MQQKKNVRKHRDYQAKYRKDNIRKILCVSPSCTSRALHVSARVLAFVYTVPFDHHLKLFLLVLLVGTVRELSTPHVSSLGSLFHFFAIRCLGCM